MSTMPAVTNSTESAPEAVLQPPAHRIDWSTRWLPPAVLVLFAGGLAIRESGALQVGDVFWHLRTGDLIVDEGLPRSDPFSWTALGEAWQPNAWLGDVLWATVRGVFGAAGISLLTGLFVLVIAGLLYRSCLRNGAGRWSAVAVTIAGVAFMSPFIAPRPLIIGFALMPITLELAMRARSGSASALLGIGLITAAWSNLHGSFVTGVGVVGLFALGWAIDDRRWRRPLVLTMSAAVGGVVNPFGVSAYIHTLDIREQSVNVDEWQPLALDDPRGVALVLFMGAAVWAFARIGSTSRRWTGILPVSALALGTFAVVRTGAFFVIVATPFVAAGISRIEMPGLRRWAASRKAALVTGLAVAGLVLATQQAPELSRAGEPGAGFPETLVAAIPPGCRLLNEYEVGGFVIDRRWPEVLVSQDGRNDLYGVERLRRQERWLESPDVESVTAAGVECVLANRDRPLTTALTQDPAWDQTGESSRMVLFVRKRG